MPRPTKHPRTTEYLQLANEAWETGEMSDCTVKALAVSTGCTYAQAREALAAAGRKAKRGAHFAVTLQALDTLGFKAVPISAIERHERFISRYPKPHCHALKDVTTHHPDRFKEVWKDGKTYLMRTARHILCIKDGVNHDWTRGTARRCVFLYEVQPK